MKSTQALIMMLLCVVLMILLKESWVIFIFGIAAIGWLILAVIHAIKEWND